MKSFGNIAKDGQVRAVASGTLTDGKAVIVNSDGTVSVVVGVDGGAGTPVVFESANAQNTSVTYDANAQKVVIVYKDNGNSNYGTAIVGTVSGASISFGSPVVFISSGVNEPIATYHVAAQKIVIAYQDVIGYAHGEAIVGTVSSTSISFGSIATFNSATTSKISIGYDASAQRVVIAYKDEGNSDRGTAIVGTVSSTSISFGSEVVFNSGGATDHTSVVYDANAQKVVIAYRDIANSNYGTAIVGTVSSTSISFGSEVVFESAGSAHNSATYYTAAQKIVISYQDNGNSNFGTAIVGTVSGTSISFGTAVVFESASAAYTKGAYDSTSEKIVIAYRDTGNSNHGTAIVGTVSGTSISFDSPIVFETAESNYTYPAYDANAQKIVIAYQDGGNSNYGTSVVFTVDSTNITSENFIGFSDGAFATTQSAAINTTNTIDRNQSGLTAGQTYFVQNDGTIGTTAADPSVTAGTAISSTELIVKG